MKAQKVNNTNIYLNLALKIGSSEMSQMTLLIAAEVQSTEKTTAQSLHSNI